MICCYDASGNVLFVNRAFEDTLGWSLAEARSNDMVASCYPDPVDRRRAMDFMMSGRADCQDFRMHCRNNDVLETSWANAPLTENIRIGIGLDITKRKTGRGGCPAAVQENPGNAGKRPAVGSKGTS